MHNRINRQARLFAVLLSLAFIPPLASAQQDADAVGAQFNAAYEAKNWDKAVELGHRLCELDPRSAVHPYNLACCYVLRGEKAKAITWLEKSADAGFSDEHLMAGDLDLDSIREEEGFKKALARVTERSEKQFGEFKARAEKAVVEIVLPEGVDATKPAPAIVALHGYGADAKELAGAWKEAAREIGAIVIAPQGLNAAGNGWEWGNLRGAEYLVMQAIEKTSKSHKIDEKRLVLTGFSQGGLMAYSIALKNPKRFRGVIPVAAGYNPSLAPKTGAGKEGYPRFFIMVGSKDQALRGNQQADKDFEAAGIPHKINIYDGVGHAFPQDRAGEMRKALKYVLE